MELIGLKVKHTTFGAGVVTEKEGNYITVELPKKQQSLYIQMFLRNSLRLRTRIFMLRLSHISPRPKPLLSRSVKLKKLHVRRQEISVAPILQYEDEKDEDGNIRKEYKFRLRKVTGA